MTVMQSGSAASHSILDLFRQRKSTLQSIERDVQAGNLGTAQSDVQTYQQNEAALQATGAASNFAGASASSNPYRTLIKADLTALTGAINAGSLLGAQAALLKFKADSQSGVTSPTGATPMAPALATDTAGSTAGGNFLGNLKSLLSSVSSGNQSGAQLAASALNQDLQHLTGGSASAAQHLTPNQTKFVANMQRLISAAQSGSTTSAQTAAQTLAGDLKTALAQHNRSDAGTQGPDMDATFAPPTTPASATVPSPSQMASPEGDGTPSAFETVQSALNLLILFSGTSVAGSAITKGVSSVLSKIGTTTV